MKTFERVYSQYGAGVLELSGTPHLQGPQPLSEIPNDVIEMLRANSDIEMVVICRKKDGLHTWAVYSPMQSNKTKDEPQNDF